MRTRSKVRQHETPRSETWYFHSKSLRLVTVLFCITSMFCFKYNVSFHIVFQSFICMVLFKH